MRLQGLIAETPLRLMRFQAYQYSVVSGPPERWGTIRNQAGDYREKTWTCRASRRLHRSMSSAYTVDESIKR